MGTSLIEKHVLLPIYTRKSLFGVLEVHISSDTDDLGIWPLVSLNAVIERPIFSIFDFKMSDDPNQCHCAVIRLNIITGVLIVKYWATI